MSSRLARRLRTPWTRLCFWTAAASAAVIFSMLYGELTYQTAGVSISNRAIDMEEEVAVAANYDMQVVAPFSPLIMKAILPHAVVRALNDRVDAILMDEGRAKGRDWSRHLAGNLKSEIRITDFIRSTPDLLDFLYETARVYTYKCENALLNYSNYDDTEALKDKRLEIVVKEGWVNDMVAGDFNPVHFHQGCLYSCVAFLRLPDEYEAEFRADKQNQNMVGCLQFIDGRTMVGGRNLFVVKPEVGAFYLWPAWMLHCVYPFRGAGVRRSMSVNLALV